MEYCIVNAEGIIENIIVADEEFAQEVEALPMYYGAGIGQKYDPPVQPTLEERVTALENAIERGLNL